MCDFREPPKFIWTKNGKQSVKYNGIVAESEVENPPWNRTGSYEKGVYLVATTGSYYTYFTGISFLDYFFAYDVLEWEK